MAPGRLLARNIRPQHVEDYDESDGDLASDEELESELEGDEEVDDSELSSEGNVREHGDEASSKDNDDVQQKIRNVSFGALKQAQGALSRKRKRGSDTHADHEDKLEALRARLRQIRESKDTASSKAPRSGSGAPAHSEGGGTRGRKTRDDDDDDDPNDSDSAPSEEGTNSRARSSKHAPAAQSSRYQVSRKRNVVDVPKRVVRDPRFDAMQQASNASTTAPEKADRAYSFLIDYQKEEIAELKRAVKGTRDEGEKETLKRKIGAMENRIKAKEAKQREQDVLRRHRKEEREKVQQGKQPFYLKRKDVKEQALVEKFKGMKSKDREKLMERRRLKESQRERRMMPRDRRTER